MKSEIRTLYAKPKCNTSPYDEKRHAFTKTTRKELGTIVIQHVKIIYYNKTWIQIYICKYSRTLSFVNNH